MERPNALPSEGFINLFKNVLQLPKKVLLTTSIVAIMGIAFATSPEVVSTSVQQSVANTQVKNQMKTLKSIQMMEWGSYATMSGLNLSGAQLERFVTEFNHSNFAAIADISQDAVTLSKLAVKQGLYSGSLPSDIRQDFEVHLAGQVVVIPFDEANELYRKILNAMDDPIYRQVSLPSIAMTLAAAQLQIDPSTIEYGILPSNYSTLSSNDKDLLPEQKVLAIAINKEINSGYSM